MEKRPTRWLRQLAGRPQPPDAGQPEEPTVPPGPGALPPHPVEGPRQGPDGAPRGGADGPRPGAPLPSSAAHPGRRDAGRTEHTEHTERPEYAGRTERTGRGEHRPHGDAPGFPGPRPPGALPSATPAPGGDPSPGRVEPDGTRPGGDVPPNGGSGPRHAAPRPPQREHATPAPSAQWWERIVLGTPSAHVEPKPPPVDPYRPDTIFDGWSSPGLTVRLASVRGDQHRFGGPPRQDDVVVAWHEPTGRVVFAVADGVSSAPHSHIGAALACRTAVNDVLAQLAEDRPEPDWSRVMQAAAYQLVMRVAGGREPGERDRAEAARQLATTLVAGTVAARDDGSMDVTVVRAGDSSAWCLQGGRYHALLHDGNAEDGDISSTAVVALPRLLSRTRPIAYTLPPDSVVLVGTDGFGVPLGDGSGPVGEVFAGVLQDGPPEPVMLAHLLDFSRETFDDDRTLLAVWSRRDPPGAPR